MTDATISEQKIRSVPPAMIDSLLGFPTPRVTSAYIIPYAHPRGGWMDHVRMKVFPTLIDADGHKTKYLGPRATPPRLFFPLQSISSVVGGEGDLWCVEGAKKALALAQLGMVVIGVEGVECWHVKGSTDLLPDFDVIPLKGRTVKVLPDGDVQTNRNVHSAVYRFSRALGSQGACVEVVLLPSEVSV